LKRKLKLGKIIIFEQSKIFFRFKAQSENFTKTLSDLCDPKYGTTALTTDEMDDCSKSVGQRNLENLASLVRSSIFFDAMGSTAANLVGGAGANPNN
jgi:hypothetical protein